MGFGIGFRSQMRAHRSSEQLQMWQEEWGAQATALTGAVCAQSLATGMEGMRMSRMMVKGESVRMVAR